METSEESAPVTGQETTQDVDSGTALPSWVTSQLPSDLQTDALSGFGKPADVVRAYLEQKERMAAAIIPPGDEATEEELAAYREKLGIPESPDAYALEAHDMPEGWNVDEKQLAEFRAKAHELGLSAEQAQALYDWSNARTLDEVERARKAVDGELEEVKSQLMKEWGEETYKKTSSQIAALMGRYGDEELVQYLEETGHGNDPRFIRAFARMAQAMVDDSLVAGDAGGRAEVDETKALRQMYPRMYARLDAERKASGG